MARGSMAAAIVLAMAFLTGLVAGGRESVFFNSNSNGNDVDANTQLFSDEIEGNKASKTFEFQDSKNQFYEPLNGAGSGLQQQQDDKQLFSDEFDNGRSQDQNQNNDKQLFSDEFGSGRSQDQNQNNDKLFSDEFDNGRSQDQNQNNGYTEGGNRFPSRLQQRQDNYVSTSALGQLNNDDESDNGSPGFQSQDRIQANGFTEGENRFPSQLAQQQDNYASTSAFGGLNNDNYASTSAFGGLNNDNYASTSAFGGLNNDNFGYKSDSDVVNSAGFNNEVQTSNGGYYP